jgi:hypothetical protein
MSRPRTRLVALALALFATGPAVADKPAQAAKPAKPQAATIDVVLCLDVSSSMQGLVDSAKAKLWDVVNELGKAKPTPNLRVGLYSYGHTTYPADKGWVRKEVDLTTDLDTVYQKLNALTINGGEELVARVTRDAVVEQKWSDEKKALKLIFVAGNEPANQDRQVTLQEVAKKALEKNIYINTIHCSRGPQMAQEGEGWKDFAKMAEGTFASINQDKGAVVTATPHDGRLNELSGKLNTTYVPYGEVELRRAKIGLQAAGDRKATDRAPGVGAARAETKAGRLYRNAEWDLVDRLAEDTNFDIKKVPEDQLPDELKKLKPAERVEYVKQKQEERKKIQKEIAELSTKRAEYLKQEAKKPGSKADKVFDEAVKGALREQAKKQGIEIPPEK